MGFALSRQAAKPKSFNNLLDRRNALAIPFLVVGSIVLDPQLSNAADGKSATANLFRTPLYNEESSPSVDAVTTERVALGKGDLIVREVRKSSSLCGIQSKPGDTMEVRYEASYIRKDGEAGMILYDSSATRGTGQPYVFTLGNGDMIRGTTCAQER
jgi:hypothetical protein